MSKGKERCVPVSSHALMYDGSWVDDESLPTLVANGQDIFFKDASSNVVIFTKK